MMRRVLLTALVLTLIVSAIPTDTWMAQPFTHMAGAEAEVSARDVAGYTPAQVRKAYGVDQLTATGAGQTIAIVVAYGSPTVAEDLAVFNRRFGLPPADLTVAYPTGGQPQVNGGWAQETALDVQWAHAIAPGAKLLVVAAASPSSRDMLAAVDYAVAQGATIVSNSWGGPEFAGQTNLDRHFRRPGVVFVAASGDHGTGAFWPAASPAVLAVGGTQLQLDAAGQRMAAETAWTGSSGGRSAFHPKPAFQQEYGVRGEGRAIPDVAAIADPQTGVAVYSSTAAGAQKGWFMMGGTSLSAPVWAGLVALANAQRPAPLTDAHEAIYALATGKGYAQRFYDISIGTNGNCGRPCTATRGFDTVTGLGSPSGAAFIPALAAAAAAAAPETP